MSFLYEAIKKLGKVEEILEVNEGYKRDSIQETLYSGVKTQEITF